MQVQSQLDTAVGTRALAILSLLRHAVLANCSEVDDVLCTVDLPGVIVGFTTRNFERCILRNAAVDLMAALSKRSGPPKLARMAANIASQLAVLGPVLMERLEATQSETAADSATSQISGQGGHIR